MCVFDCFLVVCLVGGGGGVLVLFCFVLLGFFFGGRGMLLGCVKCFSVVRRVFLFVLTFFFFS